MGRFVREITPAKEVARERRPSRIYRGIAGGFVGRVVLGGNCRRRLCSGRGRAILVRLSMGFELWFRVRRVWLCLLRL